MKRTFGFALLLPAAVLIGCSPASNSTGTTPAGPWTNWQIQAGTALTSPPNTYPSFTGAVQISGSQANGVFTALESSSVSAVEDLSGTYTSANGDITMSTYGWAFAFAQPSTPYTTVPVGVTGGCVYPPGYTGAECTAITSSPSVGSAIAPLNGTYAGTLTASSSSDTGTVSLVVNQSTTPNTSGAFPLTATLTFPSGSTLGSATLTGTITGEALNMNFCSTAVIGPCVSLAGATSPTASQIAVTSLTYSDAGTNQSVTYTGTLNLQ